LRCPLIPDHVALTSISGCRSPAQTEVRATVRQFFLVIISAPTYTCRRIFAWNHVQESIEKTAKRLLLQFRERSGYTRRHDLPQVSPVPGSGFYCSITVGSPCRVTYGSVL